LLEKRIRTLRNLNKWDDVRKQKEDDLVLQNKLKHIQWRAKEILASHKAKMVISLIVKNMKTIKDRNNMKLVRSIVSRKIQHSWRSYLKR